MSKKSKREPGDVVTSAADGGESNDQERLARALVSKVELVECATTVEGLVASVGAAFRALVDLITWSPDAPAPDGGDGPAPGDLPGTSRLGE